MLLAYVMRRAGTFTMEDKVKMLEFVSKMAQDPFNSIEVPQPLKQIVS